MTNNYIETLVALADISGGIAMLLLRSQQRMKGNIPQYPMGSPEILKVKHSGVSPT